MSCRAASIWPFSASSLMAASQMPSLSGFAANALPKVARAAGTSSASHDSFADMSCGGDQLVSKSVRPDHGRQGLTQRTSAFGTDLTARSRSARSASLGEAQDQHSSSSRERTSN